MCATHMLLHIYLVIGVWSLNTSMYLPYIKFNIDHNFTYIVKCCAPHVIQRISAAIDNFIYHINFLLHCIPILQ